MVCDSITERFFLTPGPKTKYFERTLVVLKSIYIYIHKRKSSKMLLYKSFKNCKVHRFLWKRTFYRNKQAKI